MTIPSLTLPQCNALDILAEAGELSGRQMHQSLTDRGDKKTGPNFYLFMNRLIKSGHVSHRFETKVIDGQTLREKYYKITPDGEQALAYAFDWFGQMKRSRSTAFF